MSSTPPVPPIFFSGIAQFGCRSGKCTPVYWTSFDINCQFSLRPCELVQIANSCQLVDLQFLCWCTQTSSIKQEIVYTQGKLKVTHIIFVILNSHVTIIYWRFIKNTVFMWYQRKIENSCIGFFKQETVTIKWHLAESFTFQILL